MQREREFIDALRRVGFSRSVCESINEVRRVIFENENVIEDGVRTQAKIDAETKEQNDAAALERCMKFIELLRDMKHQGFEFKFDKLIFDKGMAKKMIGSDWEDGYIKPTSGQAHNLCKELAKTFPKYFIYTFETPTRMDERTEEKYDYNGRFHYTQKYSVEVPNENYHGWRRGILIIKPTCFYNEEEFNKIMEYLD